MQDAFGSFQKTLIDMQQDISRGDKKTQRMAKRLDEEWKTTLHSSGSKDDSYFIIDIDSTDAERAAETRASLAEVTSVEAAIETQNGYHVVVEPFDYRSWDGAGLE